VALAIGTATSWSELIAAFLLGYLLGSIPFGIVLTRLSGGPDLRTIGSGNIGATNVLRTGNKWLAAATLIGDMLKGTVAVLIGAYFGPAEALAAACGAFIGHLLPVWLRFKGGKGVATFLGCLIGVFWPAALVFGIVWLLIAFITRYSSLAALWASVGGVFALIGFGLLVEALVFAVLAVILFIKHAPNIKRLLAGQESRIGWKS
jgi:glycerol-3-phosphate acyltransferase PlsY